MPVSNAKFQQLGSLSSGSDGHRFFFQNPDGFAELSHITAVEKAQSVPYLKIWRVKADGKPVDPDPNDPNEPDSAKTVSTILMSPPTFGSSTDRYPERAAVSLERASVKNNFQLGGPILYREVTLEFVVHRPELVFDESNHDYDQWSAIILPGTMFAMKYGWAGSSQNGIMNGDGVDGNGSAAVPGRTTILFVVTRYNFSINADGTINFTVFAHENCDNILNHVSMGDLDYFNDPPPADAPPDTATYGPGTASGIKEFNTQTGTTLIKKLQQSFHVLFDGADAGSTKKHVKWVKLQKILDSIFAPLMDTALRSVGYQDVQLFVGNFNAKLGPTKPEFGGSLADASIGDFQVPETWLKTTLGQMRASGAQMNLYNFFQQLMNFVMSPENYTGGLTDGDKDAAKKAANGNAKQELIEQQKIINGRQSPPEIKIKTSSITKSGKYTAVLYIIDMKQAHVSIDADDRLDPSTSRDDILKKLDKYGLPLVTFKSGLSYIESAQFQAEQDAQVQAVLISRAVDPSRYQVTNVTHVARAAEGIDPRKLLFSSAITGKATMLGNFVFDSFQMVWLEFGVRRWDGTFFIFEKEDVIENGSFLSTVTFRSTGDDPLNTQGVLKENQNRQQ